jgi:sugar lactone lactonase YvrE
VRANSVVGIASAALVLACAPAASAAPKVTAEPLVVVAGDGSDGFSGDGGPATAARLHGPVSLVFVAGDLYVADSGQDITPTVDYRTRVRKIDLNGTITTIAGNGSATPSATNTAAEIHFLAETHLAVSLSGLYVTNGNPHISPAHYPDYVDLVGRIDTNGKFALVAGATNGGYAGDGGPARKASLSRPLGIALDGAGNLYIADSGNHAVRKIDANGVIATVAGTGKAGYGGDGGLAVGAQLFSPNDVATGKDGSLYLADTYNHRVRKIEPSGHIATIAGTGTAGFSGDGSAATAAQLNEPRGLWLDDSGALLIADSANNRVRRVSPTGTITTVVGTGDAAVLQRPAAVIVGPDGIYIADTANHRVVRRRNG